MNTSIPTKTLSFLTKLSKNNNRDWFNDHKKEFKAIEAEVKGAYNYLGELMNSHDQIEKTKIFRIFVQLLTHGSKQCSCDVIFKLCRLLYTSICEKPKNKKKE